MCLREGKIDGTFLGALTPKRMDSIRQPNDAPNPSGMDRVSSLGLGKSESPKPKLDFEAIVEEPPAAAEPREAGIAAHRICSAALRSADEDLDQHRLAPHHRGPGSPGQPARPPQRHPLVHRPERRR